MLKYKFTPLKRAVFISSFLLPSPNTDPAVRKRRCRSAVQWEEGSGKSLCSDGSAELEAFATADAKLH